MSSSETTPKALDPPGSSNPALSNARRGRPSPEAAAFVDTFPAHVRLHPVEPQQENRFRSTSAEWKHDCHPTHRPQSPALPWHKEYSQLDPKSGRVLVIDFIRADESHNRKRKVIAQELDSLDGLRKLYKDPRRGVEASLRLLHVQNAPWATKFLLRKFNIDGRDELVGSNFGTYAKFTKPDRRGGKPFPSAKSWRVQHDPWRGISKTSFGFEYLKEYEIHDPSTEGRTFDEKIMELNGYDHEDNPAYGYDVYIQRLACYVQHKEDPPSSHFEGANGISNPYKVEQNGYAHTEKRKKDLPQLSSLDNENAIIIFDNSQSGSFEDCLMPARSEWETHWRRLPFYLAYEAREIVGNDDLLGRQCARMILDDVFRALVARWEILLSTCQIHVSILEDKIYEQPADETRAPELWKNSSLWLQLEKLTTAHMAVVRDMRVRLRELVSDITTAAIVTSSINQHGEIIGVLNDDDWLQEIPYAFERIANRVEEDLVKPTQALISLLYQSVSIRDSRLSLQINTSMWRLSWVAFIFLPLTFMVGFFGMNVDTFATHPSLKWYFIVTIPFMLLVLVSWYVLKHILARQRQTPYTRGIYESFFHDLAVTYPSLWSRVGPRDYIIPRGRIDRWKWWLIKRWTRPERTIKAGQPNADTTAPDDLSSWSKCKLYFIRKWTNDIISFRAKTGQQYLGGDEETDLEQSGVLVDGLLGATELLTIPAQPVATAALERLEEIKAQLQLPGQEDFPASKEKISLQTAAEGTVRFASPSIRIQRPGPRTTSNSPRGRRPTSSAEGSIGSRNSSVLVEEEDPRWINELGKEGNGWYWRPGGQSPGGRSSFGDKRRTSSGGSGNRPVLRRNIDETVGAPGEVARGSSPLGLAMTSVEDQKQRPSQRVLGGNVFEDDSSTSESGKEAERAAEETGGRENERKDKDNKEEDGTRNWLKGLLA